MQSTVACPILRGQAGVGEEHSARSEALTGMTLVLAATNGKEIVVGGDTYVYDGDASGYVNYQDHKLRVVNDKRWVIGFSGLGSMAKSVWEYLEATNLTFNPDIRIGVMECIEQMGAAYQKFRIQADAEVLLAGFSGMQPRIYCWKMGQPTPRGGETPPWGGIGIGLNVALHLVSICRPLEHLSTEQLRSLVYFCISQVAENDPRVEKPIDLAVIHSQTGAELLPSSSLGPLEEKSEKLGRLLRENL